MTQECSQEMMNNVHSNILIINFRGTLDLRPVTGAGAGGWWLEKMSSF